MPSVVMSYEDDPTNPDVMLAFYRRFFPFRPFFDWLNQEHAPTRLWTHREFAFTLKGDTYVRYNSFANVDEFKKEVLRANPTRFEIGPVYNARPRDRKTLQPNALRPEARELVFDIDMTDYDEIRTCCTGGAICRRCWGYIAAAVKVLDQALRQQMGFRHLLWVYSGRRGIHCWISDPAALALTDDQRKALVGYLEVVKGGKEQVKKVNVRGGTNDGELHPSINEAKEILRPMFASIVLAEQDCFRAEAGWDALLALLPSGADTTALRAEWTRQPDKSSSEKWLDITRIVGGYQTDHVKHGKAGAGAAARKWQRALEDVVLQYTYPRIDAEVSKRRNHLLKSPFVVHPGTGRVCVPVDPRKVDDFDPAAVPTVGQLLREIAKAETDGDGDVKMEGGDVKGEEGEAAAGRRAPDYMRTSLRPYVDMFQTHVAAVMKEAAAAKRTRGTRATLEY